VVSRAVQAKRRLRSAFINAETVERMAKISPARVGMFGQMERPAQKSGMTSRYANLRFELRLLYILLEIMLLGQISSRPEPSVHGNTDSHISMHFTSPRIQIQAGAQSHASRRYGSHGIHKDLAKTCTQRGVMSV
jgi:hypothetical protein